MCMQERCAVPMDVSVPASREALFFLCCVLLKLKTVRLPVCVCSVHLSPPVTLVCHTILPSKVIIISITTNQLLYRKAGTFEGPL